jgi:hypothetical protein
MHGDAGHLPVHQLTLARVQADTDFQRASAKGLDQRPPVSRAGAETVA